MERGTWKLDLPVRICTILLLVICCCSILEAQIISHELRRLAVATNQFGIDALKALDRIEPPDKVIVFCPVCLSSSLMMILMGSSKYQVVSSLRHALYVWSMKPHEINRGFKDIFEHIGLNQLQQTSRTRYSTLSPSSKNARYNSIDDSLDDSFGYTIGPESRRSRTPKMNKYYDDSLEISSSSQEEYLSLPKLIRMRECLERSAKEKSLLNSASRKFNNGSTVRKLNSTHSDEQKAEFKYSTSASNQNHSTHWDNGDVSQMSALSNIYIQRGLNMNYNYNLLLRKYYKTVLHPVDFVHNGEETRQHINSLVAAHTEGKIKDLIKRGASDVSTRIMIVTTFHFRGTLDVQINSEADTLNMTRSKRQKAKRSASPVREDTISKHQKSTRKSIFIETEETLLKYGHFKSLECSVVEIPFNNRLVSLVIVMPDHHNSTELLLTKLSAQILSDMINSLVVRKISIDIPVIKFDRGPVNVEGILKELNLDHSFYGDKVYTSETGFNRWMKPSDIVHETSIDIGTINPKWSQTEDRLTISAHEGNDSPSKKQELAKNNHIRIDKPFFYFVLDSINSLVLTMGRIRQ